MIARGRRGDGRRHRPAVKQTRAGGIPLRASCHVPARFSRHAIAADRAPSSGARRPRLGFSSSGLVRGGCDIQSQPPSSLPQGVRQASRSRTGSSSGAGATAPRMIFEYATTDFADVRGSTARAALGHRLPARRWLRRCRCSSVFFYRVLFRLAISAVSCPLSHLHTRPPSGPNVNHIVWSGDTSVKLESTPTLVGCGFTSDAADGADIFIHSGDTIYPIPVAMRNEWTTGLWRNLVTEAVEAAQRVPIRGLISTNLTDSTCGVSTAPPPQSCVVRSRGAQTVSDALSLKYERYTDKSIRAHRSARAPGVPNKPDPWIPTRAGGSTDGA